MHKNLEVKKREQEWAHWDEGKTISKVLQGVARTWDLGWAGFKVWLHYLLCGFKQALCSNASPQAFIWEMGLLIANPQSCCESSTRWCIKCSRDPRYRAAVSGPVDRHMQWVVSYILAIPCRRGKVAFSKRKNAVNGENRKSPKMARGTFSSTILVSNITTKRKPKIYVSNLFYGLEFLLQATCFK